MMAAYMAPGLSKVIVYEGANPNDVLNRMATDNLASQLSSSWGFSGVNATTEQIFKQYIAQGQSLMQASGDSGSYSGGIMAPSDDPNLTVVGGTSVVTQGPTGPWLSESAWSGSGGGVSTTYPIPSWQQSVAMASKGGSTSMRNIPDVALTADIQMYLICNNGQQVSVGGTSAAAPLWAGFLALANQQAATAGKARVGFLNPLIYSIGNSGDYAADMHDITVGSNGGFKALAGYDLTTGWGSPAGQSLINGLTGVSTAASFSSHPRPPRSQSIPQPPPAPVRPRTLSRSRRKTASAPQSRSPSPGFPRASPPPSPHPPSGPAPLPVPVSSPSPPPPPPSPEPIPSSSPASPAS
jgi:hypothetical protein